MSATVQMFLASFLIGVALASLARNRRLYVRVLEAVRERLSWRLAAECVGVAFAAGAVQAALLVAHPVFSLSWMRFAFGAAGHLGITGLSQATARAGVGSAWVAAIGLGSLVLFAVIMPYIACLEEILFRWRCLKPGAILIRGIVFGLMHMAEGVSLASACALAGTGLFYAYKYREAYFLAEELRWLHGTHEDDWHMEALRTSTTYHVAYNAVVLAFVGATFLRDYAASAH